MAAGARGRPAPAAGAGVRGRPAVTAVLSLDATWSCSPRWCSPPRCGCGCGPSRTSTPAPTWPTPPRCCCRCPTSPTCSRSGPAGCRFTRFAATMALPWLAAIGVEWLCSAALLRHRADRPRRAPAAPPATACRGSRWPCSASPWPGSGWPRRLGVDPAGGGAGGRRPRRARLPGGGPGRRPRPRGGRAVPGFVAALGVIVPAAADDGLGTRSSGSSRPATRFRRCWRRRRRRRAGQPGQQPAGHPAAAPGRRGRRAGHGAGRPPRGQHRAQPDLCRARWPHCCGGGCCTSEDADAGGEFLRLGAITVPAALVAATLAPLAGPAGLG